MTDAELSLLSFLADALVVRPDEFSDLIKQTKKAFKLPSNEFLGILDVLEEAFKEHAPSNTKEVRKLMINMHVSDNETQRRAAHVLNWVLGGLPIGSMEVSLHHSHKSGK